MKQTHSRPRRLSGKTHTPRVAKDVGALQKLVRNSRPLHHRIMLHPVSLMVLLLAGVLIAGWTVQTAADSYQVRAKVAAPLLTSGATITNLQPGATITANSVRISGVCPQNSYVTITRNGRLVAQPFAVRVVRLA